MRKRNLCELKIEGNKDNTKVISIVAVSAVAVGAGCLMGSKVFARESKGKVAEVHSVQTLDYGVLGESLEADISDQNARGIDSNPNARMMDGGPNASEITQKDSRITLKELFCAPSDEENMDEEPSWLDQTLDLIFGKSEDEAKMQYEIVEYQEINPEKYSYLYAPKARTVDSSDETASGSSETASGSSETTSGSSETASGSSETTSGSSETASGSSETTSDSNIAKKTREEFIKVAKSYLGKGIKYDMGSKNTRLLDCSGYVSLVLKDMGLKVNEHMTNAYKYRSDSTKIERSDLKVGDLVFWHDLTGKRHSPVYHIGFYLGEDTVIDCSSKYDGMGTRKLSSLKDKKGDHYYTFGRYEKLENLFETNN